MGAPLDDDRPAALHREPLNDAERWRVALLAASPIAVAAVILIPVALLGPASLTDAVIAALVYGGLLGLAVGFVAVDRIQARQCPRCNRRRAPTEDVCERCGYDLEGQPRFACPERHRVYVEPGLCDCGRRLQQLDAPRGIGREVVAMLKIGAWLLAFLVGVGILLRTLG
ncbi:MAG: hypothetical protein R3320_02030 [Nitriliruptorales bacterium]|nr:hypothetical protein [Nitriliruptorales bacterium]